MFSITVPANGTQMEYFFFFRHKFFQNHTPMLPGYSKSKKVVTECYIGLTNDFNDATLWGVATCGIHDNFDRNQGRKMALARSISELFNRQDRRVIWEAYFQARNGKF